MWGDADVDGMKSFGAPREKLTAIGMPATDEIFRQAEMLRSEPFEGERHPVCLILSNTHGRFFEPEVFEKYRQFLTAAVCSMPSVTWKIRLHPSEDDSFYRNMGEAIFQKLQFHPRSFSLQETVADANVVTTIYSTAGLEAMIMNRPLIVAPLTPRVREYAPWPTTGGGTYATSAEDFQAQLTKLVSDRDYHTGQLTRQEEFLTTNFSNRGHAAERIVDLLEQKSKARWEDTLSAVLGGTFPMEGVR